LFLKHSNLLNSGVNGRVEIEIILFIVCHIDLMHEI